jgi:pSer/pThr/pTyr-binding forkhead associated (FHA) protein
MQSAAPAYHDPSRDPDPLPNADLDVEPAQIDPQAPIHLQILSSGRILPLNGRVEFTLGRVNEGQPIIPDVDLGPHGGFEEGVSRLHASIQMAHAGATLTDLGSVNGTSINGQKILQHIPHPITHGDVVTLGKMRIKVIIAAPR